MALVLGYRKELVSEPLNVNLQDLIDRNTREFYNLLYAKVAKSEEDVTKIVEDRS